MLDRNRHYSPIYGPCIACYYQDGVYFDAAGRPVPQKFAGMKPADAEKAGYKPGAHKDTEPARVEAQAPEKPPEAAPKANQTISPDEFIEGRAKELADHYKINDLRQMAKAVAEAAGEEPPNLKGKKIDLARWVAQNSDE